jgi:hypothetical protein
MRFFVKTYHQHIAKLILISFSLVTILSVFHYHNYDLLGEKCVKHQNQAENSSQLFNDDLQIVCTVQFNYTKLHSINFSDLSQKSVSSDIQQLNYTSPEIYYLLSTNRLSHHLRAPPSL